MTVAAPVETEPATEELDSPLYFTVAELAVAQQGGTVATPFGNLEVLFGGGVAIIKGPQGDAVELQPYQRLCLSPEGEIHVAHRGEATGTALGGGVEKVFNFTGRMTSSTIKGLTRVAGFVGVLK